MICQQNTEKAGDRRAKKAGRRLVRLPEYLEWAGLRKKSLHEIREILPQGKKQKKQPDDPEKISQKKEERQL